MAPREYIFSEHPFTFFVIFLLSQSTWIIEEDKKQTTIVYSDGYACSLPIWIHLKFWHLRKNTPIRFLAQSCVWYQDWKDGIRIQDSHTS